MYGAGLTRLLGWRRSRIYHGGGGGAPFQSLYEPASARIGMLPQMPEWHLMTVTLAGLSAFGTVYRPLTLALPLFVGAVVLPIAHACVSAARASLPTTRHRGVRFGQRVLTAALHLLQPIARLRGRLTEGLTPWRRRARLGRAPMWPVTAAVWSEHWEAQECRLRGLEATLRTQHACVLRGDEHDRWDLEVRGGVLGAARLVIGVEDHPGGKQLIRLRWWPAVPWRGPVLAGVFTALTTAAIHAHAWAAAAFLGLGAALPPLYIIEQTMAAMATMQGAVGWLRDKEQR